MLRQQVGDAVAHQAVEAGPLQVEHVLVGQEGVVAAVAAVVDAQDEAAPLGPLQAAAVGGDLPQPQGAAGLVAFDLGPAVAPEQGVAQDDLAPGVGGGLGVGLEV